MLDTDFVERRVTAPNCIYCGAPMVERHTKSWSGQRWNYIAIVYQCSAADHAFSVRATSEEAWARHAVKLGIPEAPAPPQVVVRVPVAAQPPVAEDDWLKAVEKWRYL